MPKSNELTHRQLAFVREMLIDDSSPGHAAIRAGYGEKGARKAAYRLLSNEAVKTELGTHLERSFALAEVTQALVIREVARIAFSDPRRFFDENGNLKAIGDLDDATAAALAGMDVHKRHELGEDKEEKEVTIFKMKLWNKLDALEKLMRKFDLYPRGETGTALNVSGGRNFIVVPAKEPKGASVRPESAEQSGGVGV